MSDSSVIIVDLDVRGEREITRLADALKRWLHQQELTADIDTGRRVLRRTQIAAPSPSARDAATRYPIGSTSQTILSPLGSSTAARTVWPALTARTPAAFRSGHGVTVNRGRSEN